MMDRNEYMKKYYQEHKKEMKEASRKWAKNNSEKLKEYMKKYNKEHPEVLQRAHEKFKEKHDWVKYVDEARKRRVERLRAAGVTNAWMVVAHGGEPKYKKEDKAA